MPHPKKHQEDERSAKRTGGLPHTASPDLPHVDEHERQRREAGEREPHEGASDRDESFDTNHPHQPRVLGAPPQHEAPAPEGPAYKTTKETEHRRQPGKKFRPGDYVKVATPGHRARGKRTRVQGYVDRDGVEMVSCLTEDGRHAFDIEEGELNPV